jgi:hypothetical protein
MAKKENGVEVDFKKEVDYPISIKAAINHFNENRGDKPKMTMESLSIEALTGEGWSDDYKTTLISKWNSGLLIQSCKIHYCIRIARITGYPLCELLENYID